MARKREGGMEGERERETKRERDHILAPSCYPGVASGSPLGPLKGGVTSGRRVCLCVPVEALLAP